MKRNLSFEEISDGKKYSADDLAKVSCNGCKNCTECCEVTDDTIFLDPYDIYELSRGLSKDFQSMLESEVSLTAFDGVITPYLKKCDGSHVCSFLNDKRCSIHNFRPGFCRMFPLGRIYEDDGSFSYFIQVHECPYPNKSKIKIKQWLGIDNLKKYEAFVRSWHNLQKSISHTVDDEVMAKEQNLKMLNIFYVTPYDTTKDFYSQFEERLEQFSS